MRLMLSRRAGIWPFLALAVLIGSAALLAPRTDLPPSYHHFADHRSWLGIPNFGDVSSNVAFFVAGLWGLAFLARKSSAVQFLDARERWPYILVFLGLVLTGFGSVYYHLAPDNARLVWDRLPMTLAFMPLVAAMIAERVTVQLGLWSLPVLIAVGVGSVIQWHLSAQHGAGDLRLYAAVQVYAVLALFATLLLPARYTRGSDLLVVAGLYVVAKICETADHQIFSLGQLVSGHTLKHLAAGVSGYWILRMLQKRRPLSAPAA
ncbi:MAG: alkaline phytoceramidase [Acidobacteria bacterium]|nr:MAG: alkaline phytoceramidase [Acidobacteriota bacterium]